MDHLIDAASIEEACAELSRLQETLNNPESTDSPEKVATIRLRAYQQYQKLAALRQKTLELNASSQKKEEACKLLRDFQKALKIEIEKEQQQLTQFDSSWLPELPGEPIDAEAGDKFDSAIVSKAARIAWMQIELEESQRQDLFLERMNLVAKKEELEQKKKQLQRHLEPGHRLRGLISKVQDAVQNLESHLASFPPRSEPANSTL